MAREHEDRTLTGFYAPIAVGLLLLAIVGYLVVALVSGVRAGGSTDDGAASPPAVVSRT